MRKGILQKQYPFPVRRYVQTMSLRDNPELIALYRKAHSQPEFWPEIGEGIRAVGILKMELYILGTRLVMIVDMPDELDWDEVMARLAKLPRQAEWEDHVAQFQSCARAVHFRREMADDGAHFPPLSVILSNFRCKIHIY